MARYMAKTRGFVLSGPAEISEQRKQLKTVIESLLPACTGLDLDSGTPFRAQAIIANPPAFGPAHVAEALGVPLNNFFTMPWTLRECWYPCLVVLNSSNNHADWGILVDVVGYCFLNLGTKYQPQKEFLDWIQQGPKPIYIGFGSMPLEDAKKTTTIILEALNETGQRGIIGQGWGELGTLLDVPEDVFLLEDCPHDWLFPQCSAVVHHGGAGTTATGLRAGCPTTIVPFFGDQFFWGDRIHERGVGPAPIPISELNVERLANAIRFMLQPEVKLRVMELARLIENEDGVAAAVNAFHRHLPPELPLPPATVVDNNEHQDPFQWFLLAIERWCCLPCFL